MLRLRSSGRKQGSNSKEPCVGAVTEGVSRGSKLPTRFSQTLEAFHAVPYARLHEFQSCYLREVALSWNQRKINLAGYIGKSELSVCVP